MSAEEIETKLSIWKNVGADVFYMNSAFQSFDSGFFNWEEQILLPSSKNELSEKLVDWTASLVKAYQTIEILRREYPEYPEISNALILPNIEAFKQASADFTNAIRSSGQDAPSALVVTLKPLAATLRREMDITKKWLTGLAETAESKVNKLSELK